MINKNIRGYLPVKKLFYSISAGVLSVLSFSVNLYAGSAHAEHVKCSRYDRFNDINVKVVGHQGDLIQLEYDGLNVHFDPLRDGKHLSCRSDIFLGPNYIVVRHGRDRDLIRLYGIKKGEKPYDFNIKVKSFNNRDGDGHKVEAYNNSLVVRYGRKKDLGTRFCFVDGQWFRSPGNARGRGGNIGRCTLKI